MTPPAHSISVVMPSYNESANIVEAMQRIISALGDALLEIIIVDDNSPDRTWELVEKMNDPRCKAIRRMDKRGLASALADGTRAAQGDIIVWLDCDLGIPPEDIRQLVEQLGDYDVAIGSRYMPGGADTRPAFRAFLSRVFNWYTRTVLGYPFRDWTSGFAAARADVMRRVPLSDKGFGEYFVDWVYRCFKARVTIVEVPYHYGLRKGGESKTDSNVWVFLRLSLDYAWRVLVVRMTGGSTPSMTTATTAPTTKIAPYTTTKRCRVCGWEELTPLYSLGDLYVSNFVKNPQDGIKAPLEMVLCEHCSLVQLKHTAPQELLYARFYWYRSGVTQTMRDALRDITLSIEKRIELHPGDVVVDIGSNDGTMLRTFAEKGLVKVGVEPASNLAEEGKKGLEYFINDFWLYDSYWKTVGKKAKVITAIGMFYDMEDPNQFIRDAALSLDQNGIFVAQLMCLKNMLDTNDVGNICHEHLEFYSLSSLEFLLEKNGLKLFDIELNNINGGSYRVYACLTNAQPPHVDGAAERLEKYRTEEKALAGKKVHLEFAERIERNKKACVDFIKAEVQKGKRVWIYGASTKGNTILQYYGLDHRWIEGAAERSPEKWGKFTVGTGIPIFSEEEARKSNPDYFLVLPYAFFEEFYKREEAWRKGGGKFLVPIPEFRVVA